jgi:hypothetical protein
VAQPIGTPHESNADLLPLFMEAAAGAADVEKNRGCDRLARWGVKP